MSQGLKSWGYEYNSSLQHSSDAHCPNPECNWQLQNMESPMGWNQHIVGFSIEAPTSGRQGRIGAFIVECPSCFERYFFTVPKSKWR